MCCVFVGDSRLAVAVVRLECVRCAVLLPAVCSRASLVRHFPRKWFAPCGFTWECVLDLSSVRWHSLSVVFPVCLPHLSRALLPFTRVRILSLSETQPLIPAQPTAAPPVFLTLFPRLPLCLLVLLCPADLTLCASASLVDQGKVKNSWGTKFGVNGYFYLVRGVYAAGCGPASILLTNPRYSAWHDEWCATTHCSTALTSSLQPCNCTNCSTPPCL